MSTRKALKKSLLALAFVCVALIYWPGLSGQFLFDDYPNIVDNHDVQPQTASFSALMRAVLSSPSSEFKRPLASLSFALNYLATGLDAYWMKLTNLAIHLLNGLLVFLLARLLIQGANRNVERLRVDRTSALIAITWMLLPINVTAVLYVVQRMESLANLFVLLGLIGYVQARRDMQVAQPSPANERFGNGHWRVFALGAVSVTFPAAIGVLAKETAVLLPAYAIAIEWTLFHFRSAQSRAAEGSASSYRLDWRIVALFTVVLVLPGIAGCLWILPNLLRPVAWATRDFTLTTRLLSEARIVVDYIGWTLVPTPNALSFYHDQFPVSSGLLMPASTLLSIITLLLLVASAIVVRVRKPLVALGIALFLICHSLTATVLPLELIYEHRNYFASFGILLAIVPELATVDPTRPHPFALIRGTLLACLLFICASETLITSQEWGNPLRLAEALAARAPDSPRAQYELGRTYIVYSHYEPTSPFTTLAYAPLERAAALPGSSILPEQALIFMNARMKIPIKEAWWNSLISKLASHKPTVQDESSLGALTQCAREQLCDLPASRMEQAFAAALSHPQPSARLLVMYSDYVWNVLNNHPRGLTIMQRAVATAPNEPAYHVSLARMYIASGDQANAERTLQVIKKLNVGGSLDSDISSIEHALKSP